MLVLCLFQRVRDMGVCGGPRSPDLHLIPTESLSSKMLGFSLSSVHYSKSNNKGINHEKATENRVESSDISIDTRFTSGLRWVALFQMLRNPNLVELN